PKGLSSRLRWEAGWPCVPAGGGTPPGRGGAESPRRRAGDPPQQAPPGCYLVVPYRLPGRAAFSEVADRAMCVGAWWPLLDALVVLVALVGLVSGLGGAPPAGASAANTGPAMSMVARSEVTIPFMGLVPPARSYTSITLAVTLRAYRPLPREQAPCRGGGRARGAAGSPQGQKPLWHSVTERGISPREASLGCVLATPIGRVTWTRRARAPQPALPRRPSWAAEGSRSRSGASGTPWGAASGWRRTPRPPCDRARRTSASRNGS